MTKVYEKDVFSYVSLEERVPEGHPLRAIRRVVDDILSAMSRRFDTLCAQAGRPSIRAYLRDVFHRISSHPVNRLEEVRPDRWLAARTAADA